MFGRIHSFQSLGAVDGPGLRFVVFFQGCSLRCVYCHNPDTWDFDGGTMFSIEEILAKVLRYKPYFGNNGGVTLSGGEPLQQAPFARALLKELKEKGIHTALDTSGIGPLEDARGVLEYTDLVICDLKFASEQDYLTYAGGDMKKVLAFLELTQEMRIPLWVRHVVVPGLNDSEKEIRAIAELARSFSNLEKLQLLPFQKMCKSKYDALGLGFPGEKYQACSEETIQEFYERIGTIERNGKE